ncbi:MAG: DUF4174 domain-containing protein [Gammaproteobacteria bacterium]
MYTGCLSTHAPSLSNARCVRLLGRGYCSGFRAVRRTASYSKCTSEEFAILLVGYDGGVKDRSSDPEVLTELFNLIDGMPIRQMEMGRD